jgi:hypothetical protein
MSFAIGCWVRDTVIVESQKNIELDKQILSSISTSRTNISTTIPGMQGHKMTKENQRSQEGVAFNEQYLALIKG